jgi:hypothetical protein
MLGCNYTWQLTLYKGELKCQRKRKKQRKRRQQKDDDSCLDKSTEK